MTTSDFYAGLTTLQLPPDGDQYDLGHRLALRRTYAHLMSSYTMAFNPPDALGRSTCSNAR